MLSAAYRIHLYFFCVKNKARLYISFKCIWNILSTFYTFLRRSKKTKTASIQTLLHNNIFVDDHIWENQQYQPSGGIATLQFSAAIINLTVKCCISMRMSEKCDVTAKERAFQFSVKQWPNCCNWCLVFAACLVLLWVHHTHKQKCAPQTRVSLSCRPAELKTFSFTCWGKMCCMPFHLSRFT